MGNYLTLQVGYNVDGRGGNEMSFDFGNANSKQKKAIKSTAGPLLITAGPGTGKTFTLVQRAIYLIQECDVKPEEIFIATFTEKAAKELVTRITNELADKDVSVNVNEMYIGTFHSICLRIFWRCTRGYHYGKRAIAAS